MTLGKLSETELLGLMHTAYSRTTQHGDTFICVESGGDKGHEIAAIQRTENKVYVYNAAGLRVGYVTVNEYAITGLRYPLLSDVDSICILQKLRTWDSEVLADVLLNEINRIFPRPGR